MYCSGVDACTEHHELNCPKHPHFCGYYLKPGVDVDSNILDADNINEDTCNDDGDSMYLGGSSHRKFPIYVVVMGAATEAKPSEVIGSRPFEQIACQFATGAGCKDGICFKADGSCHSSADPSDDHHKNQCNSRNAWHDKKLCMV